MADTEPSVNLSSLLTLAVVSFFVIRWFLSSRSSSGSAAQRGAGGGGRRVDPAQVEQIAQMFPQLNRRDIMWDLQRNGGSMAATTERVLGGRGLETPPPSFQPQVPTPSANTARTASSASRTTLKSAENLISRYNLNSRVEPEPTESTAGSTSTDSTIRQQQESIWSQNKSERQRLLQKRRDDMIIAARKKLQEKGNTSR